MKLRDVTVNPAGGCTIYFEENLDGVEVEIDPALASQIVSAALLAFAASLVPGIELRPTARIPEGSQQTVVPITNIRPPNRKGGPSPSEKAGPLSRMNEQRNDQAVQQVVADVAQSSLARASVNTVVAATETYLQSLAQQQVIRGATVTANGEDVVVRLLRTDEIEAGATLTAERRADVGVEEFFAALRDTADMAADEFGDD